MTLYGLPGAKNLAFNPDFEETRAVNDYWSPYSANGTYSFDTDSWSGNGAYKYTVTTVSNYLGFYSPAVFADARRIIVTPGLPYSGVFRIKGVSGVTNKSARVGMHFKDDSNATISEVWGQDYPFSDDKYYEVIWEGVIAPVDATFVEFRLFANHFASGTYDALEIADEFLVDGADFRQASSLDTFVAGNQGEDYFWEGTAHRSASLRNARVFNFHVGRGGLIKITPELFKANKLNAIGEDVTDIVKSGMVEMRSDRPVKMQFKGQLTDPSEIEAFTDYFAPYLTVELFDGTVIREQVGLYSTPPMKETLNYGFRVGALDGYDLTWNLRDSTFSGYYSVAAGKNIVNEVISILASEGFTRYAITPSTMVMPLNKTWKASDNKLTIINDMLEMIGYYTIFADGYGIFRSFPYNDLLTVTPAAFYFSGEGSSVVGVIQKEPLIDNIYNHVKIIKEDQNDPDNSFVYELINMNELSPVSIPRLGRTKFLAIEDSEIVNETVAAAKAKRIIQDAASLYTKYTMQTFPDPRRSVWEVYDAAIYQKTLEEALVGRVRVSGWDLGFTTTSARMTHYIHRLEEI